MAAQAGLCLAWSETPEDTFCHVEAQMKGFLLYDFRSSFTNCIQINNLYHVYKPMTVLNGNVHSGRITMYLLQYSQIIGNETLKFISYVTDICIKQIMHSFCVYIQSLTTASGNRLFCSVVRAMDFWPRGPGFESFSAMPYFSSLRLSCRKMGLVRDRTLFRQKLALRHHKWWLPRNGGVLRISA